MSQNSFYAQHREECIQRQKEYNRSRRCEISEYNKKYYYEHKQFINLYRKVKKEFIIISTGPIIIKKNVIVLFN
jgi:hypothetical protein